MSKNNKIRIGSIKSKTIPIRENGDNYYYVTNFEQTTEKECKDFDKTNRTIYEKYLSIYNKIEKQLENCPFKLDKKPQPPESPTNLERLVRWKQNNIEKNVRLQSISLIYLLSKNIKISLDYKEDGILPYEIIERANLESNNNLDIMIKEANEYINKIINDNSDEILDFGFKKPDNKNLNTNQNYNQNLNTNTNTNNNIYPILENQTNNYMPSAPPYSTHSN